MVESFSFYDRKPAPDKSPPRRRLRRLQDYFISRPRRRHLIGESIFKKDMEPLILGPRRDVFSSFFDDIRPARHEPLIPSRLFTPSTLPLSRPSLNELSHAKYERLRSPSPAGRIIPITVEHVPDSKSAIRKIQTRSSNHESPIVIDDSISPRKKPLPTKHSFINLTGKSSDRPSGRASPQFSPVIIEDDVTGDNNDTLENDINIARESMDSLRSLYDNPSHWNNRSKVVDTDSSDTNCIVLDDIVPVLKESDSKPSSHSSTSVSVDDPQEREVNDTPSYPIYAVLKEKLAKENRQIDYIRGDGNCFFRALSKQLYRSEQYHQTLRSYIVDLVATNKSKFAQFVDGENVQKHVEQMSEEKNWATTCEIYAAATLLQRDIFMLTPNPSDNRYSWLQFRPVFHIDKADIVAVTHHPCYITLCNTNGNHYDRVVADHGGCNCFLPQPDMEGVTDSVDLTQ